MPETGLHQLVGQVLLLHEVAREVVAVLIAVAVAQLLHQAGGSIAQMQRHRQVARLLHLRERLGNAHVGRIALGRSGQIHRSFGQRNAPLGPANLHHRIKRSIGQQQRVGIGQTDVLRGTDDQSAGYELRVLPTLYHASHPVESSIRVASANALDEGRDDVVVHLAILVVSQRILLQTLLHKLVADDHLAVHLRLHHQLQNVQQLTCIAAAVAQQRPRLLQLNLALRQLHILRDGPLQQLHQVGLLQRLQHVQLATRQQRTNHLKRRILRRGTNERHHTPLHSTQQRVLLRLRETVNLVDEQYRRRLREETARLSLLNHIAHILHAARHSRQRVERRVQLVGNNLCQRRLAHPRRAPQDKRRDAPRVYHLPQHGTFAHQMLLPNVVVERARTHSFSQWFTHN